MSISPPEGPPKANRTIRMPRYRNIRRRVAACRSVGATGISAMPGAGESVVMKRKAYAMNGEATTDRPSCAAYFNAREKCAVRSADPRGSEPLIPGVLRLFGGGLDGGTRFCAGFALAAGNVDRLAPRYLIAGI